MCGMGRGNMLLHVTTKRWDYFVVSYSWKNFLYLQSVDDVSLHLLQVEVLDQ